MAEWFKATVLKTVVPSGTGGSNPSASATSSFIPIFPGDTMIHTSGVIRLTILALSAILIASCGSGGPPKPGREMAFPDQGVTIKVADGWECEVTGVDWATWTRVQNGRSDEPWIFPPVTCRDVASGGQGPDGMRYINWRFKGVKGVFDPNVNPLTSQYPVPPGLWALDAQKLELLESEKRSITWPGLAGTEAWCRLYENTHGAGATSAIWNTYTVIFVVGENTYEFVMSLPDYVDYRDYIDRFWTSIEDVQING